MPTSEKGSRRACCMVSELLEEAGIDREHVRAARKQVLEGIVLLCQWQLQRMEAGAARPASRGRKSRKVSID
jgi:hypothetical protein